MIKRKTPLVPVFPRKATLHNDEENNAPVPDTYKAVPVEVVEEIINLVMLNLSPKEACLRVGISPVYFAKLVSTNFEGLGKRIAKAKLQQKIKHLKNIYDCGKEWKCSAWFLERAYKEDYGREVKVKTEKDEEDQVLMIGNKKITF